MTAPGCPLDMKRGFMDFWSILLLSFVIAVALVVMIGIHDSKKQKEFAAAITRIPDFTAKHVYRSVAGYNGIAIDEGRSKVCLFKYIGGRLSHRLFDYRDILSSEISEDGHTVITTARSSQVGGVLVGGALLGGVGAVIGGLSGKKVESGTINSIILRLVVNDSDNPTHDISFLATESKRDEIIYKASADYARQWQARLDVLINRAEKADSLSHPTLPKEARSLSDELRALADLKDSGILTDAEFTAQKSKLLS